MMVCAAREVNSLIILNNHISATFEENSGAEIQLGWTTW
jgi:peroxiredoxin